MARKHRTCVSLTKKEACFIDNISKGCGFSNGRKLSRALVLRALLSVAKKLDIDLARIKNKEAPYHFFHMKSTIQHYKKRQRKQIKRN
ncbi:MAG: hypothetical protein NTX47_05320 [Candidatus Omnitrophica bacterium]|nr:hypothetical protein [Candidatus Omnitrophota bacterium]